MLIGIAVMFRGPTHNFTGAWEFVVAVLVVIVAIFIRMYGGRGPYGRRSAHRSKRRTSHSPSHAPERDDHHGHQEGSERRP